jgi:predicted helicase
MNGIFNKNNNEINQQLTLLRMEKDLRETLQKVSKTCDSVNNLIDNLPSCAQVSVTTFIIGVVLGFLVNKVWRKLWSTKKE